MLAHLGAGRNTSGAWAWVASVFIVVRVRIFSADSLACVLHGRTDDVRPAGPFTQIKKPAPLTTEREVLAAGRYQLLARRTLHLCCAFAGHLLIVDGNWQKMTQAAADCRHSAVGASSAKPTISNGHRALLCLAQCSRNRSKQNTRRDQKNVPANAVNQCRPATRSGLPSALAAAGTPIDTLS